MAGNNELQELVFHNVHVYEARSEYWTGQTLKQISGGESLYLNSDPWGFTLRCLQDGRPHSVVFTNGTVWGFCGCKEANDMWPLFVKDFLQDKSTVRASVSSIFSDSMSLRLSSKNAFLNDLLIWHHAPCVS
jgi:hypothetical protein